MAVDANEQLTAQLMTIAAQGVSNNQVVAHWLTLAFSKDLFQGGQGEAPVVLAGMNAADRTPVVKT